MIRTSRPHLGVATFTHAGLSGKKNEDRLAVASYQGPAGQPVVFAAVSDGIGGNQAGEVAAQMAVRLIVEAVTASNGVDPPAIMQSAIQGASQAIAARAARQSSRTGMGATCACVWVQGETLYGAHVGDSRIYLVRNGRIQRLTVDHSWVHEAIEKGIITAAQARTHPNAHVLLRFLGSAELPEVDLHLHVNAVQDGGHGIQDQGTRLSPGDVVLVCTDGLTDMMRDDEILRLVTTRTELRSAAEDLVGWANERGGYDNITVALIGMPRPRAGDSPRKSFLRRALSV